MIRLNVMTKHMCQSFHPHSISWNGYWRSFRMRYNLNRTDWREPYRNSHDVQIINFLPLGRVFLVISKHRVSSEEAFEG